MDETNVELAISGNSSNGGHDDGLAEGFQGIISSNIPQKVADDSDMVENAVNDAPQRSHIAGVPEERKSVPPSNSEQVHHDIPPQPRVTRNKSKRLVTYTRGPKRSKQRINSTRSHTRTLDDCDRGQPCLYAESLNDTTF